MENWKDAGACRGKDPSLFFPVTGLNGHQAKSVCAECIVKAQCLDVALRDQELGIWGGTDERDRRRILRRYYRGSKDLYSADGAV